ncbi:TonB-dependent receptor family protein [Hyphomicrobium denitrificans]|nr:TonB-dependent receptor [Hyphomicrobium denitrificans]
MRGSFDCRVSVIALLAFVPLLVVDDTAQAQDAAPSQSIVLPDVTVQQGSQKPPPQAVARKPPTNVKKKVAAKKSTPPSAVPKPTATPSEVADGSALPGANLTLAPAAGNPGTPSTAVASVPGASGAGAQTATGVDMTRFQTTPVFSVNDILHDVPGVSLKQGNGPRDMGISIRGSNARNGFGIRNIVILDDGFPVTQPDGLSRSDLIDPHAYAGIDVWRGPSSALFGNYATGGAMNFRTWPGGVIDGVEYGIDVGSFNYLNNYAIGGKKGENWEGSIFTSDVRGDGYFGYSDFNTQTVNALLTYQPSSTDTFTFKFINNNLYTELPFRASLNQFKANPYQKGCETAATAAPGCVTNNFFGVPQTAEQAGANRDDRRTIGGFRWDHAFDAATTGQVQVVIDDRDINQPTGSTSAVGDYLSYNVIAGITNRSTIAGLPARAYLGAFWNYLPVDGQSFLVAPSDSSMADRLQSETTGSTTNFGARAREEVKLTNDVAVVAGATVERTSLDGTQRSYTYDNSGTLASIRNVSVDREMTNIAPEVGVLYTPNNQWQFRARIGTGYGTPQFSNLFVTPDGQPGNNTDLKTQTNIGYDLGADWTPVKGVMLSVTGFYEFFTNEIVSQAPLTAGLSNFSFNAPASEHRGIEAVADFTLTDSLRLTAAYLYNNQIYTDYDEVVAGAAQAVSRAGNKIPGVSSNELTARLSYDTPSGLYKGVGAYVEYQWHDGFYMENANLLWAPGYETVDVNVHYERTLNWGPIKSFLAYFEVRNVLDEVYIASANNITDKAGSTAGTLADAGGSIYAGAPRAYYGGMKVRF